MSPLRVPRAVLVVLLSAWCAAAGAQDLAQARRLVDARAYVPALEVYDALLRQEPRNADLLIEAARVAGFADRNAEAADRYRQALLADPSRRMDVVPSLAWQSLWAGRYQEAAGLFDELLQRGYEPSRSAQGLRDARLGRARELVGQHEYPAALTWYDALLASDPADADRAIERARVLGFADRNAEAAQAYADVVSRYPGRRRDVLEAWAWQRLWSGDAAGALAQFDELLASGPSAPSALHGRAEACAALGQHDCALEAWSALLVQDPTSTQAELGAGRALMWSGRDAEALVRFDSLLAKDPSLRDARIGRAYALNFGGRPLDAAREFAQLLPSTDEGLKLQAARAYYWAGMPEKALPLLAGASLPEAIWLRDFRVARERRHYVSGGYEWSDDSDDLTIGAATGAVGWRLPGNGTAELSLRSASIEGRDTATGPGTPTAPPDTRYTVRGNQAMLTWAGRFGDETSRHGIVWPSIAVGARDYGDWTSAAWRARVRYLPTDGFSFNLDAGNGLVETIGALRNEVQYVDAGLGAEARPTDRWRISGGYARVAFEDGNDRNRVTATAEYLALPTRRLRVGVDGIQFVDSAPTGPDRGDLGYWNPQRYTELRLFSSFSGERGAWSYDGRASAGYYQELDGWGNRSSGPTAMVEGVAAYDVADRLQLRFYGGASWSGMGIGSGGTGYHRTYVGLSLTGYF